MIELTWFCRWRRKEIDLHHTHAFSAVPSELWGLNCKTKISQNNTLLLEFHPIPWTSANSFTQNPHPAGPELLLCYKTSVQVVVRIDLQHLPCYQLSPSLSQSSQHPDPLGCLRLCSSEPKLCSSVLPSWKLWEPVYLQNEILLPAAPTACQAA